MALRCRPNHIPEASLASIPIASQRHHEPTSLLAWAWRLSLTKSPVPESFDWAPIPLVPSGWLLSLCAGEPWPFSLLPKFGLPIRAVPSPYLAVTARGESCRGVMDALSTFHVWNPLCRHRCGTVSLMNDGVIGSERRTYVQYMPRTAPSAVSFETYPLPALALIIS